MNNVYIYDYQRNTKGYVLRFLWVFRLYQSIGNKLVRLTCKLLLKYYREHYGLEIPPEAKIGKGLYIGHAFNITINPRVIIGENCNIHKGVLIGQSNRGKSKGYPT